MVGPAIQCDCNASWHLENVLFHTKEPDYQLILLMLAAKFSPAFSIRSMPQNGKQF